MPDLIDQMSNIQTRSSQVRSDVEYTRNGNSYNGPLTVLIILIGPPNA